jgi:hypothetical protein
VFVPAADDEASMPAHVDPDFAGLGADEAPPARDVPDLDEVESIVCAAVALGLMNGYISHRLRKFAVSGTRNRPALLAGWPCVAEVLRERHKDDRVPGWKREEGAAGGMVLHLSSAAPAGN